MTLIQKIKKFIFNVFPLKYRLSLIYYINFLLGRLDKEMFFVNKLLINKRKFIDIGSNVGIFSYYFSNKFNSVESFDPICDVTNLYTNFISNVHVHNVAISTSNQFEEYYIPMFNDRANYALSSLKKHYSTNEIRYIQSKTLDSYQFNDVDLIKIDVEGAELDVLRSGVRTILQNKPFLLIEIEQRHNDISIDYIFKFIESMGYKSYFLNENKLYLVKKYNNYINFSNKTIYINNFIFIPSEFKFLISTNGISPIAN